MTASHQNSISPELQRLQQESFSYFWHEVNPQNGLVGDKSAPDWPASIAATGMALASYPIAVDRGFIGRQLAVQRVLTTLRFFWNSAQGTEPDATGYRGFYYHFLDMQTGRRAWKSELSSVDSTFLFAGALTVAGYFLADSAEEHEIRELADALFCRADWQWMQNGADTVSHGWRPESGSFHIGGKVTTKPYCYICSDWVRRRTHYQVPVIRPGLRVIDGSSVTAMSTCMQDRYSRISCRISG